MRHLALLLLCVHLGTAALAAQTDAGPAQPTRINGSVKIPAEAEVSIFPATEANLKKNNVEGLRADFEIAVSEQRVVVTKVQENNRLAGYKLPDPTLTYWFLARDRSSQSVYQGHWSTQSSGLEMEKLPGASYQITGWIVW